jgi:type III restriction enzyme
MVLSTEDVPTLVEVDPIAGERAVHDLNELRARRPQEVAYRIALLTLDRHFRGEDGAERPWLFPQLLDITKRWLETCVYCKDGAIPQMLVLAEFANDAADRIQRSVMRTTEGEGRLGPVLRSTDSIGSTASVDFTTTKGVYATDPMKSHLNFVALDSNWEAKLASTLEGMSEVQSYVKNQSLGFQIPYSFGGTSANYLPDFIVRLLDGSDPPLNVILEVTGERKKDKAAKVATATDLWVPAVNNHGAFGRWAFLEIADPWDAASLIRSTFRLGSPVETG